MGIREAIYDLIHVTILRAISGSFIDVETQLKYNQAFTFTDPQSIPDLATVSTLIGEGGTPVTPIAFTESDLEDDGFGGMFYPYALGAGEVVFIARIDYASSSEQITVNYDFSNSAITGFLNPNFPSSPPQMDITVYKVGQVVIPPPTPPEPVFTLQPTTPLTIVEGNTLTLSASASNTTGYQWYKNGVAISGATSSVYTKTLFTSTDAGTYKVAAIGAGGSTDSTNSVVSYDAGVIIQNLTGLKTDYTTASNPPVSLDVDFGTGSNILISGQSIRMPSSTLLVNIVQSGPNSLPVLDGVGTAYANLFPSPNDNPYAKPVGGYVSPLRVFNNA